jgi:hypothetical protein
MMNACCSLRAGQRRESRYSVETDLRIEHDAAALVDQQVARNQRAVLLQL